MSSSSVLLVDDGELESVRLMLEELGAEYEHVRASDSNGAWAQPGRLLIVTARAAHRVRSGERLPLDELEPCGCCVESPRRPLTRDPRAGQTSAIVRETAPTGPASRGPVRR